MNMEKKELIKLAIKGLEVKIQEKKKSLKTGENLLEKRLLREKDTSPLNTEEIKVRISKLKEEINKLEKYQSDLEEDDFINRDCEETKINYLRYNRKRGNFDDASLTLPGKSLDTIIETCRDYSRILLEQVEEMDENTDAVRRARFKLKASECNQIADKLVGETGYCKDCSKAKNKKDKRKIGGSAFDMIVNGYQL